MEISEAWKQTCRVLLGRDVGDIQKYGKYLKKYVGPVRTSRTCCISGRQVTTGDDDFMGDAPFISNDEREEYLRLCSEPFSINEIKDMDSLLEAVSGRFAYSGGILLGKCHNVHNSHRCSNALEVHDSQDISDCKYVAHTSMLRHSSFVFGSDCTGEINFVIKNFQGWRSQRMLETTNTQYVSDAYYCANVRNCQELLFCFNQRNGRHMVGNLSLPRDKYLSLKGKLLSEIADELERKRDLPSIAQVLGAPPRTPGERRPEAWDIRAGEPYFGRPADYPVELDSAFSETCRILFGSALCGKMTDYEAWLMRHVRAPPKGFSGTSGKPLWVLPIPLNCPVRNTHVTEKEAEALSARALSEEEAEKLGLQNCRELLSPVAFYSCEVALGNNREVADTVSYSDAQYVFGSSTIYGSRRCAYDCWVSHNAENMFGCDHVFYSRFCINCYRSLRLSRCFEVNDSLDSSDCYFCHNVENCHECMFCFNAKNLRCAIGNVEFPGEEYLRLKRLVLRELVQRINGKKGLGLDIYNLGSAARPGGCPRGACGRPSI